MTEDRSLTVPFGLRATVTTALVASCLLNVGCINVGELLFGSRHAEEVNRPAAPQVDSVGYGSLVLETEVGQIGVNRYWIHPRLKLINNSARNVRPFLIRWYIQSPPGDGDSKPIPVKQWTELRFADLPVQRDASGAIQSDVRAALERNSWKNVPFADIVPGQAIEHAIPLVVETAATALLISAEVDFTSDGLGECILDPARVSDASSIDQQPTSAACKGDGHGRCRSSAACETQSIRRMIRLEGRMPTKTR